MTAIPGYRVPNTLVPKDSGSTYPVTDPLYGIDGWRSVANATARNAIPDGLRREGMMVAQQSPAGNYQLKAGPWVHTDADWTLIASGPGGSTTQVQFNDAGSFNGDANFTFDKTTGITTPAFLAIGKGAFTAQNNTSAGASANNLNTSGQNCININLTVGSINITGINIANYTQGPNPFVFLWNSSTIGGRNITLKSEDTGSTAANRFSLDGDTVLTQNNGVVLAYDTNASRWRVMGKTLAGGTETRSVVRITAVGSTTLDATNCQVNIDAAAGNITIIIPTAASVASSGLERVYHLKRVDFTANTVTIQRTGSDTFVTLAAGVTSFTMLGGDAFELCGDTASSWWVVS
jgi:hypothetical protein